VVILRRRPNLHQVCQHQTVRRSTIVAALESVCRGLVPGNSYAGLELGRSIFQLALMTGKTPTISAVGSIPPVRVAPCRSDMAPPPPHAETPLPDRRRATLNRLAERAREAVADTPPTFR
jgi:hypothetical protein